MGGSGSRRLPRRGHRSGVWFFSLGHPEQGGHATKQQAGYQPEADDLRPVRGDPLRVDRGLDYHGPCRRGSAVTGDLEVVDHADEIVGERVGQRHGLGRRNSVTDSLSTTDSGLADADTFCARSRGAVFRCSRVTVRVANASPSISSA